MSQLRKHAAGEREEVRAPVLGDCPSSRLGAYIRKLREGYGYTLRRVEERAISLGETIDNSQLSRFEKGKAVPSFEKLRALARIFNVSVQTFSDVLDLEALQSLKPDSSDFESLLRVGSELLAAGEHGRAFVTFERAVELTEDATGRQSDGQRVAEARWLMVAALKSLGKLTMVERELREILKQPGRLSRRSRMKAVLLLSHVYRDMGDFYLSSVLGRECLDLALEEGDLETQACVHNSLGNIQHANGDLESACRGYRQAIEILEGLGGRWEMRATVLTNFGGCLVEAHRFDEGVARLREAQAMARQRGFRRVAALSTTRLAEAFLQRGDNEAASQGFAESDALASGPGQPYNDILFLNAFRRWEMARADGNPTREKIAFGRLRHLRSLIERRFPEVDEFDHHVERTRRRYENAH